ncbi:MAG: hypothetical protein HP496_16325 [Nitrospira sp.]|nr:hypothetical protein [Nitrospira sp.]
MHLSIAIPEAQVVEAPALLRLVRMAPAFDVEADEQGVSYVALFEDFPKSVEVVVRLIEEAWDLHDVQITLEARPVVSRIKFYVALLCYRGSLGAPNAEAYCLQRAASVNNESGCPDRACLSHCQFMCSRCVGLSRHHGASPMPAQLMDMARAAEVDWCPNLRIVNVDT